MPCECRGVSPLPPDNDENNLLRANDLVTVDRIR